MNGFPMMFAGGPWLGQPREERDREERVPQRVVVAMRFLSYCTDKTGDTVVPGQLGNSELSGQELTVREQEAQAQACHVLTSYFKGELALSELELKDREEREAKRKGTPIRCPQCNGNRFVNGRNCPLCHGAGGLMVEPANYEGPS